MSIFVTKLKEEAENPKKSKRELKTTSVMKKIVSVIILFVAIAYGFSSCGEKTKSEGMQVPSVVNGPLGEYYDIVSVNVRPLNEEETKEIKSEKLEKSNFYKIVVEVKKNAKAFDFDPAKIKYTSYMSDGDVDVFCVLGIVNSSEGEELESFSFKGRDGVESLLLTCTKEGASKKFSAQFDIKKEEDKCDKNIELTSVMKTTAQELEQLKEGVKMIKEMQTSSNEETLSEDNNKEEEW